MLFRSPVSAVIGNALNWLAPGACIDETAVQSVLGEGHEIGQLARRFQDDFLGRNLATLHETFVDRKKNRECACQEMTHEEFRSRLASDIAERIRCLVLT